MGITKLWLEEPYHCTAFPSSLVPRPSSLPPHFSLRSYVCVYIYSNTFLKHAPNTTNGQQPPFLSLSLSIIIGRWRKREKRMIGTWVNWFWLTLPLQFHHYRNSHLPWLKGEQPSPPPPENEPELKLARKQREGGGRRWATCTRFSKPWFPLSSLRLLILGYHTLFFFLGFSMILHRHYFWAFGFWFLVRLRGWRSFLKRPSTLKSLKGGEIGWRRWRSP